MDQSSFEEVIKFAIEKEQEAMDFYKELSETAKNPAMKPVFLQWSDEEKKHKELLENIEISNLESINDYDLITSKIRELLSHEIFSKSKD